VASSSHLHSTKKAHATPQETLALIEDSTPTPEKPYNRKYAIMLRPDASNASSPPDQADKAVMIGVLGTPRPEEIAYKLSPEYWGRGYMSEAVNMYLAFWWSQPGVPPLFLSLKFPPSNAVVKRIQTTTISSRTRTPRTLVPSACSRRRDSRRGGCLRIIM
jgi:hypothetical protein